MSGSRAAAQVTNIGNFTSYAGFYQVNATLDQNTFVWYFPAQNGNPKAPLLIWLQGTPSSRSPDLTPLPHFTSLPYLTSPFLP